MTDQPTTDREQAQAALDEALARIATNYRHHYVGARSVAAVAEAARKELASLRAQLAERGENPTPRAVSEEEAKYLACYAELTKVQNQLADAIAENEKLKQACARQAKEIERLKVRIRRQEHRTRTAWRIHTEARTAAGVKSGEDLCGWIRERLAEIERLKGRAKHLRTVLKNVEWESHGDDENQEDRCPCCNGSVSDGHSDDCDIAAALVDSPEAEPPITFSAEPVDFETLSLLSGTAVPEGVEAVAEQPDNRTIGERSGESCSRCGRANTWHPDCPTCEQMMLLEQRAEKAEQQLAAITADKEKLTVSLRELRRSDRIIL